MTNTRPAPAPTTQNRTTMKLAISVALYALAVITANWVTTEYGLVPVGFGFVVVAGTYAAGFALLARDFVHRYGGWKWALAAVAAGAAVSFVTADPFIAAASAIAFGTAELIDLAIFTPLRKRGFIRAAITSNLISAPLDTIVFLWVAGFPLTAEAITGQFIGKFAWATLIPLAIYAAAVRTRQA